ncbi:YolD-like family protein [Bacillus massilinigeriensis]|uniref:YolD-like family protein n=1 Tax=Bacillus mediterraneensis TaxID=1805474 RepID=UPI0008F9727C|nr:YolD-like family protein [Bacillus mediterraneensis]
MIRDRGRIKWTSMMLPEHVGLLREWAEEDKKMEKKELDEQELERLNEVLLEAMEFNGIVEVNYYRAGRYEKISGHIQYWDELAGRLHIIDTIGDLHRIVLSEIADVRLKAGE